MLGWLRRRPEPLLREDFAELYLFARRLGLKVMLFTNARGVTPRLADLLALAPPRELVEVSVYGMSAKTYEAATRRRGSYEEFRRGVELLLDRAVRFVVKGALLPGLAGGGDMEDELFTLNDPIERDVLGPVAALVERGMLVAA